MKVVILLLALMLVVGGAKVFSAQGVIDEKGHLRQDDGHHPDYGHSHHQALPLLEMLPPIGPIGIVAIVVVADMNYFSREPARSVRGTEKKGATRPRGDTNATAGSTPGITTKLVKELTLREKVVGAYEMKEGERSLRMVLLENGIGEGYQNGKKEDDDVKWKLVDGALHLIKVNGDTIVIRINKDDSLTMIAEIGKDGIRNEAPKQVTFKKIK